MSEFLGAALEYASRGFAIFPLISRTKKPLTSSGFHDATVDPGRIREWWREHPEANVGAALGDASGGRGVIDVDPRNGGEATWARLVQEHGDLPETPIALSGRRDGGRHIFVRVASGQRKVSAGGIDLLANGQYVVLPPSVHPDTGEPYTWHVHHEEADLVDLPEWLAPALRRIEREDRQREHPNGRAEGNPCDGKIPEGERHSYLLRLGGAMRRIGAAEAEIRAAFLAANARFGMPEDDAELVRQAKDMAGRWEPEPQAGTRPSKLLTLTDLAAIRPPPPLAEGFLRLSEIGCLYGDTMTYKSFVALSLGLAIAHGHPTWMGRALHTAGPVIFSAGEGQYGIPRRVQAWQAYYRENKFDAPFFVWPRAVQLCEPRDVEVFIAEAEPLAPVKLVVIDTLHTGMAGRDENLAADMGKALAGCARIRDALGGPTVLLNHHIGKDKEKGPRGSSSLSCDADALWRLARTTAGERTVQLTCEKSKDDEAGAALHIEAIEVEDSLVAVPTGTSASGEPNLADYRIGILLDTAYDPEDGASRKELLTALHPMPPSTFHDAVKRMERAKPPTVERIRLRGFVRYRRPLPRLEGSGQEDSPAGLSSDSPVESGRGAENTENPASRGEEASVRPDSGHGPRESVRRPPLKGARTPDRTEGRSGESEKKMKGRNPRRRSPARPAANATKASVAGRLPPGADAHSVLSAVPPGHVRAQDNEIAEPPPPERVRAAARAGAACLQTEVAP